MIAIGTTKDATTVTISCLGVLIGPSCGASWSWESLMKSSVAAATVAADCADTGLAQSDGPVGQTAKL